MSGRNKAILGLALLAVVLACGGWGRGSWGSRRHGPVRTGPPGGIVAADDTFKVIFTLQDVLSDNNNPASIDSSLVVGIPGSEFATVAAADFARRLQFTRRLARADSVHILGTSGKVVTFAAACIDTADGNGYQPAQAYTANLSSPARLGAGPYTINRNFGVASRRSELVYIPWEKYIPSGSTIVSATLNIVDQTGSSITSADSMFVNQLVRASDNKWWTTKDVGTSTHYPNYARTGWNQQIVSNGGSGGWGAVDSDNWVPSMRRRTKLKSWGSVQDSTGLSATTLKAGRDINIKNCVQAVVSGAGNNGFIMHYGFKSQASAATYAHYAWDEVANAVGRSPYVEVIYTRTRYVGALDITPPAAPTGLAAFAGDKYVTLSWNPVNETGGTVYKLYRFWDGAPDTTVIWAGRQTQAVDATAINGSPNNYFVTVVDENGNESADSAKVVARPKSVRSFADKTPPVFYADMKYGRTYSDATIDTLADYDCLYLSYASFYPGYTGYDNFVTRLRGDGGNPNELVMTYINVQGPRNDWYNMDAASPFRKIWNYCVGLSYAGQDSGGFALNMAGHVAGNTEYPTKIINYMYPAMADTMAKFWVDALEGSGVDGEYCGFLIDFINTNLQDWICGGDCAGTIDMNQNNDPYGVDPDESDAYDAYCLNLLKAFRREFAQRGMQNRLLMPNGNGVFYDDTLAAYCDGWFQERYNDGTHNLPGYPNTPSEWEAWKDAADPARMPNAQVTPPLIMCQVYADSSCALQTQVIANFIGGWAHGNVGRYPGSGTAENDYVEGACGNKQYKARTRPLPNMGSVTSYSFVGDGESAKVDTLVVNMTNSETGKSYVLKERLASGTSSIKGVWPYLVYEVAAQNDTLSRSYYWPRQRQPVTIAAPQLLVTPGDNALNLTWQIVPDPGNVDSFDIYRSTDGPVFKHLAAADVRVSSGNWAWMDATVKNDSTSYCYIVVPVSAQANDGSSSASECETPSDVWPPQPLTSVQVTGGTTGIDLRFWGIMPADFSEFHIFADYGGLGFALIDSTGNRTYTDTAAPSGVVCSYYVKAVDDDNNKSTACPTSSGMWWQNPQDAVPTAFRAVASSTTIGTVEMSWVLPVVTAGIDSLRIEGGTNPLTPARIASVAANVTSYSLAGVTTGVLHVYRVRPWRSGIAGDASNWAVVTLAADFPPTQPQLTGGGTDSGIQLSWSASPGAVKYRIYRGSTYTEASSQCCQIDSTTSATTYLDTGASATDTHFYTVRGVSSGGTASLASNYVSASWAPAPTPGVPTISGVTGTIAHGSTLTVSGSGFGAREGYGGAAVETIFDGMEAGAISSGWSDNDGSPNGMIAYNNSAAYRRHANSTAQAMTNFNGAVDGNYMSYGSLQWRPAVRSEKYFCQYWIYLDSDFAWGTTAVGGLPTSVLSNVKIFRLVADESYVIAFHSWDNGVIYAAEPVSSDTDYAFSDIRTILTKGAWHCFQFEAVESQPNVADGSLKFWIDGTLIKHATLTTRTDSARKYLQYLGWFDSFAGPGAANHHVYWDDFYASTSIARVEIGDNADYDLCTHRETQVPASWSDHTITLQANTGSFATDADMFLFVVDEDGNVSDGKAITNATPAPKNYLRPTASQVQTAGVSARLYTTTWPADATGSITVRCVDTWTGQVVDEDTSSTGATSTGPTLTGLVVGWTYRLEYKTTVASGSYDAVDTWTPFHGPFVQKAKGVATVDEVGLF